MSVDCHSMRAVIRRGASLVLSVAAQSLYATPASADEELMNRGGCISCHRVDQKLLGPAFKVSDVDLRTLLRWILRL